MEFTATPFAIKTEIISADMAVIFPKPNFHNVFRMEDYDERRTIVVQAETPHDACENVWLKFQNISEFRKTPDRGRSLMTGDMARLIDETGKESWWIVCSFGWAETVKPTDKIIEVRR